MYLRSWPPAVVPRGKAIYSKTACRLCQNLRRCCDGMCALRIKGSTLTQNRWKIILAMADVPISIRAAV
jgi:hypothetical protein